MCVKPPPGRAKHILASLFAGNVRDACGPKAERRRRFSSNNSAANSRMTSTFCACIRCRTRKTIRRSRASARSTPLFCQLAAGTRVTGDLVPEDGLIACLRGSRHERTVRGRRRRGHHRPDASRATPTAVCGDRGVLTGRDHRQESRGCNFSVERRCPADVRVYRARGHRTADHDNHPSGLFDEEHDIQRRLRAGERIEHYETIRVTKAGERVDVS